jgi:hypothetical protein
MKFNLGHDSPPLPDARASTGSQFHSAACNKRSACYNDYHRDAQVIDFAVGAVERHFPKMASIVEAFLHFYFGIHYRVKSERRSQPDKPTGLRRQPHLLAKIFVEHSLASLLFLIRGEGLLAVASTSHHFSTHGRSTTSNAQVERC